MNVRPNHKNPPASNWSQSSKNTTLEQEQKRCKQYIVRVDSGRGHQLTNMANLSDSQDIVEHREAAAGPSAAALRRAVSCSATGCSSEPPWIPISPIHLPRFKRFKLKPETTAEVGPPIAMPFNRRYRALDDSFLPTMLQRYSDNLFCHLITGRCQP